MISKSYYSCLNQKALHLGDQKKKKKHILKKKTTINFIKKKWDEKIIIKYTFLFLH